MSKKNVMLIFTGVGLGLIVIAGVILSMFAGDKHSDELVIPVDSVKVVDEIEEDDDDVLELGDDNDASIVSTSGTNTIDSYLYTERLTSKNLNKTVEQMRETGKLDDTGGSKILLSLAQGDKESDGLGDMTAKLESLVRDGRVIADTTTAGETAYADFELYVGERRYSDGSNNTQVDNAWDSVKVEEGSVWSVYNRPGKQVVLRASRFGGSVYLLCYYDPDGDQLVVVDRAYY